jgi:hypothetical protein
MPSFILINFRKIHGMVLKSRRKKQENIMMGMMGELELDS